MTTQVESDTSERRVTRRSTVSRIRNWPLWRTPAKPLILILAVEALAVTCLVAANADLTVRSSDVANFVLILVLSVVFAEAVGRLDVMRRYLSDAKGVYNNPTSVWLIAGVLVLPTGLAVALPVLVGVHSWIRNHRTETARTYRLVYSVATTVVTCSAAAITFHAVATNSRVSLSHTSAALGVVLAIAVFSIVSSALVWAVMWLVVQPERFRDLMLDLDDELLEHALLCIGALLAVALVSAPALSPLVLLIMVVLQRSALVRQLQEQATKDARTGLLNAGAWRREADRELDRSARNGAQVSLLMVDLDHFKRLNDTHGHPAGDQALAAVAACLSETLRGYDALGRYGGEEFSALLVDADELTGEAVAERVCAKVRELELPGGLSVTASIGVATARASRTDLDTLISRADAALYAAKHAGRDRVRCAAIAGARVDV